MACNHYWLDSPALHKVSVLLCCRAQCRCRISKHEYCPLCCKIEQEKTTNRWERDCLGGEKDGTARNRLSGLVNTSLIKDQQLFAVTLVKAEKMHRNCDWIYSENGACAIIMRSLQKVSDRTKSLLLRPQETELLAGRYFLVDSRQYLPIR